ncbi:mitogen-activated protein kinase kinase kinase 1-like isoform X2 [Physella acuta]|uniref:mitogen-activated protein kinase kinase kinase 1-like isoform X2 n=1 Tax=Physella acuta TaxID=109671 RepID=UPI0027DD598E|nr:mitogen-activated protein kinase kinase kinase 1-like isoform X2 [Physella acuta]
MASICTAGPVVESSSVSTSAASAEFEYSKTEIHTIHLEPSPSITCEGCTKGANYEETFQGPHKWRRILRHVPSTKRAKKLVTTESSEQRNQNPQNFDSDQDMATEEENNRSNPTKVPYDQHLGVESPDIHGDQDSTTAIPPWSKEFIEKSNSRRMYKQPNIQTTQGSQIPVTVRRRGSLHGSTESAFTRQVVNSNNSVARKKLSPSNSFRLAVSSSSAHPGRRITVQQSALSDVSTNIDVTKKRIERVQRARLYLLQQTGPNSFLIGGDSPDHKYRVIIGPQTCSCGRGPHCVHVLFVMLRVFQVGENDPCLWSRTLKNYEVESLFRIFHDKRSSRITKRTASQRRKEIIKEDYGGEGEQVVDTPDNNRLPSESDTGSVREEEETCPICLLEMLEGESLICCENGCHNRLHHHCIAIWFEECRRQNDPLNCPLCRAQWKSATVEIKSTQSGSTTEGPDVPPNTRASSPHHNEEDSSRLPHAEPIPAELEQTAAPWVEALGSDLVSCLLSRNWSIREVGLKHLSKEVVATLLKGTGEGRSGVIVSPVRRAATHNMLQTACNILAYTCADPVYRVFVASLRAIRTLLSYTPCRDAEQRNRLQLVLKPIVEAIILKCTDGNRRTSQLSLSTLVELVKGQEGELAVGREIINPGNEGLDGLNYVLKCVTEDYDIETVPWQWLLGRLYVIDRLLEEFPTDFLPRPEESVDGSGAAEAYDEMDGAAASSAETRLTSESCEVGASNYARLMSVAHFSVKAVCSTHMRIARMSRRVFLLSAKLGAHVQKVISELKGLLAQIDSTSVASLRRKLDRIVEDFQLSERIVHELMHGSGKHNKLDSPCHTPAESPSSTPRCNSPVFDAPGEPSTVSMLGNVPNVPPNTPTLRNKRKLRRAIPRRSFRESNNPPAPPPTSENSPEKPASERLKENLVPDSHCILPGDGHASGVGRLGSSSPPNRRKSNLPRRRRTIEGETVSKIKRGGSSSPTIRRRTVDGCTYSSVSSQSAPPPMSRVMTRTPPILPPVVPVISVTDMSQGTGIFNPVALSDLDENGKDSNEETDSGGKTLDLYQTLQASTSRVSDHVTFCGPDEGTHQTCTPVSKLAGSTCCCQCRCHESVTGETEETSSPKSGAAGVPNSPDSHYHTAEHESMSSDDFLDFSQNTQTDSEKPVSFKSEVAESPKSSPSHSVHSGSKSEDCGKNCKEEVEREEAEALAKALDVSERQDPCPVVPGLTPTAREEVITIRIQPDSQCDEQDGEWRQPTMYLEKVHWVKGPLLGTGAYSSCYQARDVRTGVIMAVKQISFCRNSAQEQEKVIEAISEEIHMMARLSHPNIVRILGATKQGCHFNMFVEWMPGGSVAYLLGEYGAFTENVIVNYTRQILRGLAYLHDNHILHRDLKGANLLIDSTGQTLRIGDFGASARLASQATGAGEFQGQLLGTIAFMAPEVLRGESYGRACDIWSVGCVMIEMSTTKPPWNATDISNHLALIFKIASSVDSPPIPENLPPPVRDLMLRCLEQNSEDRPSAKDLLLHPLFTQCFTNTSHSFNGSKLGQTR